MADAFDMLDDTFDDAPPAARAERETVPEGNHAFTIKAAEITDGRLSVTLVHEDARYYWVKANPPTTAKSFATIAGSLARVLGMTGGQFRDAILDGGDGVVGRRVGARIWHKAGDRGGLFANVGEFHQPEPEAAPAKPAAKPAARTATKKADAATRPPEDDIPF
jgi:hypothetical protein